MGIRKITLKHKILLMSLLGIGSLFLLLLVSQFFMKRNTDILIQVENTYVPTLKVVRDMENMLTEIQRCMQDAVAAADEEKISKADILYDEFLQLFESGAENRFFKTKKLDRLNLEFQGYYVLARRTSISLIKGKSLDEDFIKDLEAMRRRYNSIRRQLQSKTAKAKEEVSASFSTALKNSRQSAIIMNTMIVSITFVLGGLSLYVSRSITIPLSNLVRATERITKGDLTQRIKIRTGDEVAVLGNAMERMRVGRKRVEEELKQAHEELERRVEERTAQLVEMNTYLKREIEERKRTEEVLKSTQAQLVQSGKLASIGELAAGVAHELNQPLMVIRTTTQLFKRSFQKGTSDKEKVIEQMGRIERNTKRMMNIIGHLRIFSRQSKTEFSAVDVNEIMECAFLMVTEQFRLRAIEVKKNFDRNLPKVKGDANQLEQVVLNILTNARDAIMERKDKTSGNRFKGILEVATKMSEMKGDSVEILFRDNGCGISAAHQEGIFDPFFTTKEVGKGTGLGLSISYGIIQDHCGRIDVAETGPEGSIFRVTLPIQV